MTNAPIAVAKTPNMVMTPINAVTAAIADALKAGEKVQLIGFGTFEVKARAERTGRNPHTNEPVPIPARVVPSFKAGKYLKKAVTK